MNNRWLVGERGLYWITLGILVVLVLLANTLLISRQYHAVRADQRTGAEAEISFLAALVTEALANEQYHLVQTLFDSWGPQHAMTTYLSVEVPGGFVLARYARPERGEETFLLVRELEYGYQRSAVIKLETDLRGSLTQARDFAVQVVVGSCVLLLLFGQLLLLLDRMRKQRVLETLAHQDGLTGVANRRRFERTLPLEWRRARRGQFPLALIMADIDAFKAYNDHLGHQAGDDCLRKVAATLAAQVSRPADLVARYGGEEFVVILPETDLENACRLAESMRAAVAGLALPHRQAAAADHVTLSLGVAALVPHVDLSPELLVAQADRALYLAKRGGGNRIAVARTDGAQPDAAASAHMVEDQREKGAL